MFTSKESLHSDGLTVKAGREAFKLAYDVGSSGITPVCFRIDISAGVQLKGSELVPLPMLPHHKNCERSGGGEVLEQSKDRFLRNMRKKVFHVELL
jgi:hypothetical protein